MSHDVTDNGTLQSGEADQDLEPLREPLRPGVISLDYSDEPSDDDANDGDDELDDELEEADRNLLEPGRLREYGQDLDAPWTPVPLTDARKFLKANPDAKIDLVFPEAYAEDRSAKLKDLLLAQAADLFSHHRVSDQAAQEFGFESYDFDTEQQAIRDERRKYPELGAGDAAAARGLGKPGTITIGAPSPGLASEDEDDLFNEPRRADLRSPDRAWFRRQQREASKTLLVERGRDDLITRIVEVPGIVPVPATPEDRMAWLRRRRQELQAQRAAEATARKQAQAEAAAAEAAQLEQLDRGEVLRQGREIEKRLLASKPHLFRQSREAESVPKVSKVQANYRYASPDEPRAKFGVVESCGTCFFFKPPDACRRVDGVIRPVDVCDLFHPKTRPA